MLSSLYRVMMKTFLSFIALIAIFTISVAVLSKIPVNSDYKMLAADQAGHDIYVRSNGVHTDIVLPVKTSIRDWQTVIPQADLHNADGQLTYISFGWGDKGFYLDTPTWADLKFSTAVIAATGVGSTAMHVEALKQPEVGDMVRHIRVSDAQLSAIVNKIDDSFSYDANSKVIRINTTANYNEHDAFYEAQGHYSIFTTCNEWTSKALSHAGIKTAFFTPLQDGVMHFLPE